MNAKSGRSKTTRSRCFFFVFLFFLHDIGVFGKAIVYISRLLVTSTP